MGELKFLIVLSDHNVSLQLGLQIQHILAEDPKILRMLDQLSDDKKNKVEKKFSKQDVESIFDLIENNNRIKDWIKKKKKKCQT